MNIEGNILKPEKNVEKTLIYLVRHGESVGNKNRVCLGHTDLDLTDLGLKQAKKTAEELSYVDFDAIYSSDLIRAFHTAEPHAQIRGKTVITSENLRELYFGEWENASVPYLIEHHNEQFTVGWRQNFGTFTAPGGESVVHMAERMAAELENIAFTHLYKNILITSHAAAIRALWGKISGLEPYKWASSYPFPSNASYSIIEYKNGVLIPISYSNDAHLGDLITFIK